MEPNDGKAAKTGISHGKSAKVDGTSRIEHSVDIETLLDSFRQRVERFLDAQAMRCKLHARHGRGDEGV